jgi:hypothetical protein
MKSIALFVMLISILFLTRKKGRNCNQPQGESLGEGWSKISAAD